VILHVWLKNANSFLDCLRFLFGGGLFFGFGFGFGTIQFGFGEFELVGEVEVVLDAAEDVAADLVHEVGEFLLDDFEEFGDDVVEE